ncbi:MAG: energy transducer TonB [Xanthomonadales bacterium]|nr:energy transducer TonB [Xanthomonadales bacterium]
MRVRYPRTWPSWLLLASLALGACGGDEPAPAPTSGTPAAGATPVAPTETAPAAPAAPQTVPELLDAARTAMREQRLVQPEGDNAIEYYLKVLDAEPENRHATLAILELMPLAQGVAEQMIETNRFDEAQAALRLLKRAQPTSVVVTNLEQRIVQQRRAEEQRLRAEEEQARLAERQERERAAAATSAAQAAAAQAAAQRPPPATTPRPTAQPAATPAAPPASAPAAAQPTQVASAAPAPSVASASAPQNKDFQLVKRVNPNYPPQALRSRTEGWVELAFTITADGNVEGVEVVDSQPRRIFDRDAMRALSQWKFSPRIEGGKPVAAKARQRLTFSLN